MNAKKTEEMISIKMEVHPDALFLLQSQASGKTDKGEEFEFSTNISGGSPIVQFKSKKEGHWICYTLPLRNIIDAVIKYREKHPEV
jgi:hypothetical protein